MVVQDLHSREQIAEVVRDEVFEREVAHPLALSRDLDEPGQHRRHLEACELLTTRPRVADADRQVQGEARDVGEGVGWVHRQRHENRKDLVVEVVRQAGALVIAERGERDELDSGLRKRRRDEAAPRVSVAQLQSVRLRRDVGQGVFWGGSDVGGNRESGDDAALEPRYPDHEELVEVARENGEEVRALQRRDPRILSQLEDALIEREPAQLTIQEAVNGQEIIGCCR